MGWFDGNSTTLQPLPELTRNKKMAKLAGGVDKLFQQLEQAMTEKEYQWGLMVADMLVGTDLEDNAKLIKAKILRKMAELESNPNARHYYFTQAKELENKDFKPAIFVKPQPEFLEQLPVASLFAAMPASLIAEDTLDVVLTVEFWITDIEQTFTIQIRNGIAEVQNYSLGTPDVKIETSSQVWKEIASKIRNPVSAIISGDLSVSTGKLKLIEFLGYFDLPDLE
jgi:alkyl sulfatase BDS1-like metallo-beta-lactamase superfamily hydrolase